LAPNIRKYGVPNEMSIARAFASVQIPSILRKVSYNFFDDGRSFMHAYKSQRPCEEVVTSFNNAIL
jgi:hypothetical protein